MGLDGCINTIFMSLQAGYLGRLAGIYNTLRPSLFVENLQGQDQFGDIGLHVKVILKYIFKK